MSLEPTVSVVFLLFSTCLIGENLKQEDIVMPSSLWCLRRGLQVRTSFLLCVIEEMRNCPENPEDGHLTAGHSLQYCPSVGDVSGQAPS